MPQTKPQKIFFSIVMAILMVYPMELYNLALQEGGITNDLLWRPFLDLPLMGVLVIVLESIQRRRGKIPSGSRGISQAIPSQEALVAAGGGLLCRGGHRGGHCGA